jgi:phenylalanyl-tRNA synthetase beta chain
MKVLLSWLREFVDVPGTAEEIGARMSERGLALEGIERVDDPLVSSGLPRATSKGDDAVIDFDVTANRADCLSIRGIVREIATAYQLPLKDQGWPAATRGASGNPGVGSPEGLAFMTSHIGEGAGFVVAFANRLEEIVATAVEVKNDLLSVRIADPDLCSRYVAGVADVRIGPSPAWMQRRLIACGVRPINNVVDVTNYVLLECGYPMHAFDYAKLDGPAIVVRRARDGERLTTLDGKARALDREMLVIADATRAQAIGGVMGGAESEVSSSTTRIVLEAAWFKPTSVRATSKRLGLRTEASYRFERGADLTATADAMARALELIQAIDAGRGVAPMIDCFPVLPDIRQLTLDKALIRRVLGMEVPDEDAVRILKSLGFTVRALGAWQADSPDAATPVSQPAQGWRLQVPDWRVDISRPVDVVEEIGRHYGFEHLPSTFPAVEQPPSPSDPRIARDARVRRALVAMGISEAITFAFIESAAAEPLLDDGDAVVLANPLSEKFTTLRPSLLPGLIDAVSHNRRHGMRDIRLFEIGTRFSTPSETRGVAVAWTGAAVPEHWSGRPGEVDLFDVKGVAERLAACLGVTAEFVAATRLYLVDGRAAEWRLHGRAIGVLGQLSSRILEARDLPPADAVYVLEVDLDALSAAAPQETRLAKPLPRHPAVVRDIAILVDDTLSAEAVRDTIRAAGPDTLVDVREFDRYHGTGIPEGKISLALHLTFQAADRTLTDMEVGAAMQKIVASLSNELGAIQR